MAFTCEVRDGIAVAVVSGRIDGFTAGELQGVLDPALANPLVRFAVFDLTADYSVYDREIFSAAFYVNPANPNRSDQVLHNHGVFFTPLPFPEGPTDLYREIQTVVQQGDFADMRHLLDGSRIRQAVVGISYTQEFQKDPAGQPGHIP